MAPARARLRERATPASSTATARRRTVASAPVPPSARRARAERASSSAAGTSARELSAALRAWPVTSAARPRTPARESIVCAEGQKCTVECLVGGPSCARLRIDADSSKLCLVCARGRLRRNLVHRAARQRQRLQEGLREQRLQEHVRQMWQRLGVPVSRRRRCRLRAAPPVDLAGRRGQIRPRAACRPGSCGRNDAARHGARSTARERRTPVRVVR